MAGIRTYESFSGFIASTPNTEPTVKGKPRFYAQAGQNQYRKESDGSYTKTGTEYLPTVAYDKPAAELTSRFIRGDSFVAEGYTRPYSYEKDGQAVEGEEFVIWKVGHDAARTRYDVDRAPRQTQSAKADRVAATAAQSHEVPAEFEAPATHHPADSGLAL
ncbi:single-stranded DNA-binding protein [Propionibacterium freudenreichii]|uniref:single-stranded DNA-binding protein n=1 Tax=Propionibacterium freudenreichii TaxID=1744 RepID=UPI0005427008|nr:single-stranded DNA-binding protein [Propionibacterium freudenreichii]CEG93572.1 Single-strand binding protein/Primosomal replication protein [Propionibacterium freudenreichii]